MTMLDSAQMDDFPYPDERTIFNKKDILKELLTAIEKWYCSSSTPRDKRIVVTGSGITKHVYFGTFKNTIRFEEQESFKKLRKRVFRLLNTFATERAGKNTWLFTIEAINILKKEIGEES